MRNILIIALSVLPLLFACNNNNNGEQSGGENDVDAARNFIRAALDGQYQNAKSLIVADSVNQQYLEAWRTTYTERMNGEDKRGYREASINIHNIRQVNDSVTVIQFSNSYKKTQDSIKVIRENNIWLVDLKYSFANTDSLP